MQSNDLAELRKRLNLTVNDIAAQTNVSPSTVRRWEKNKTTNYSEMLKICAVYQITIEELVGESVFVDDPNQDKRSASGKQVPNKKFPVRLKLFLIVSASILLFYALFACVLWAFVFPNLPQPSLILVDISGLVCLMLFFFIIIHLVSQAIYGLVTFIKRDKNRNV